MYGDVVGAENPACASAHGTQPQVCLPSTGSHAVKDTGVAHVVGVDARQPHEGRYGRRPDAGGCRTPCRTAVLRGARRRFPAVRHTGRRTSEQSGRHLLQHLLGTLDLTPCHLGSRLPERDMVVPVGADLEPELG